MKIRCTLVLLSLYNLTACQTTSYSDYAYIENKLDTETIKYVVSEEFTKRTGTGKTKLKFIEDGSYLELKYIVDPGFVLTTKNQDKHLYSLLCGKASDKLTNFVQKNRVGVKIVIEGDRSYNAVGPWNSDICDKN